MKYLKTLNIAFFIFVFSYSVQAQACRMLTIEFSVRDDKGEMLKDVYFEFFENNKKDKSIKILWEEKKNLYVALRRICMFHNDVLMKVSSREFETYEQKINYEDQKINISLKRASSIAVSGVVYDPLGALIVGADILVKGENDRAFYAKTNDDGIYKLELAPANYEIEFASSGFKRLRLLNFNVVNSTNGKLNHDVVLTVRDCDDCNGGLIGENSKESNIIVLDFKNQTIKK